MTHRACPESQPRAATSATCSPIQRFTGPWGPSEPRVRKLLPSSADRTIAMEIVLGQAWCELQGPDARVPALPRGAHIQLPLPLSRFALFSNSGLPITQH